jgi:hypothetical protein
MALLATFMTRLGQAEVTGSGVQLVAPRVVAPVVRRAEARYCDGLRRADESRADPRMGLLLVDGLIVLAPVFGWKAVRHVLGALREPDRDDSGVPSSEAFRALLVALTSVASAQRHRVRLVRDDAPRRRRPC